jgi:hypothetical protein
MSQAEFKIPEKVRNPGWANLRPAPKGVALNPAGRPKGSRNKLAESFIRDVYEKWEDQGPAVLGRDDKEEAVGVRENRGWLDASEARNHQQIPEFARC